ncbi:MAG TPA: ferritin [Balneolales bacterium]|nr:ferritin [Balneolales bacterium]
MKKSVVEAVNNQIQAEFSSAYLYLAMSAYFAEQNLNGFASWMRIQWQEELQHGLKFYDMLIGRDVNVTLKELPQPEAEFGTTQEAFKAVLEHEKKVTKLINELYQLASKENDYPLQNLLQWFIDEQVEEENNARDILNQLKLIGDNGTGLFMLDRELSQRASAGTNSPA